MPALAQIAKEYCRIKKFVFVDFKGKGAYKETYHVIDNFGNNIALKILIPNNYDLLRTSREINIMKKCNSPYIGKFYGDDKYILNNVSYHLFLEEYFDAGSLNDKLYTSTFPINDFNKIAVSLVRAVDSLRILKFVHRDIKPENVMFSSTREEPYLIDFGIARDLSCSSLTPTFFHRGPGTAFYSSPEQLNNEKHFIDWRSDQFCLGIVLGICLTGFHPFQEINESIASVINKISNRTKCTNRFIQTVTTLGFEGIIRMIQPWPILRYPDIESILKILS